MSYFIDKGGKSVVESLDLFFLMSFDGLDVGVDLQAQWSEEAFVDSHSCHWGTNNWTSTQRWTHSCSIHVF